MKSNEVKSIAITFMIITVFILSTVPRDIVSWRAETSTYFEQPLFSTHQWLAWEAVEMFSEAKMGWITENLYAFWHGVEAPFNSETGTFYGYTLSDYGDIEDLVLYLDATGTIVTDSSLADRAQEEYNKLVSELSLDETDFEQAAFYAGTMSHYISQAGIWKAVWDDSLWGPLNESNWVLFEDGIERGNTETYFDEPTFNYQFTNMSVYYNDFFDLSPNITIAVDGSTATVNLAKQVFSDAQYLSDEFNSTFIDAIDWEETYYNTTRDCLTFSVEATYAALEHAMVSVDWKTISMEDPVYTYDNGTGFLEIPDFSVNYTDNGGLHTLTAADIELAEFRVIIYPEYAWEDPILSAEHEALQFNVSTQKWYHNEHLVKGTSAYSNHTILYTFKMNQSSLTWSNISVIDFSVDYFKFNLTSIVSFYNETSRTVDITHVVMDIYEIPEVGELDPSEVSSAEWILYTRGEGFQGTVAFGFPAYDTEGYQPHGNLAYDALNESWYAIDNDIGLVFTDVLQEFYIVVQFEVTGIPVGYYWESAYGEAYFVPECIGQDNEYWFKTRDHQITISAPTIIFDAEANLLSAYNITAYSDYNNTELDYYEIVTKAVWGQNVREASWRIFMKNGYSTSHSGDLLWDWANNYWYVENIDVGDLKDGEFYISAKIINMNTNTTIAPYGLPSECFIIGSGEKQPSSYLISMMFVTGLVIPGIIFAGFMCISKKRKQMKKLI